MNTKFKSINAYVQNFLTENCDEQVLNLWLAKKTQSKFKTLVNKKTKVADPSAPKRAKSAYLYFCSENREKVKSSLKNPTATNVTKELGKRWNKLKEKKKSKEYKKFVELAEADSLRYKKEKQAYVEGTETEKGPKRAKSAYLYFCDDFREKVKKELGDVAATKNHYKIGRTLERAQKEW